MCGVAQPALTHTAPLNAIPEEAFVVILRLAPDARPPGSEAPQADWSDKRNTGWLGAIRRMSLSGASALTPSKKMPTSALQRLR